MLSFPIHKAKPGLPLPDTASLFNPKSLDPGSKAGAVPEFSLLIIKPSVLASSQNPFLDERNLVLPLFHNTNIRDFNFYLHCLIIYFIKKIIQIQ